MWSWVTYLITKFVAAWIVLMFIRVAAEVTIDATIDTITDFMAVFFRVGTALVSVSELDQAIQMRRDLIESWPDSYDQKYVEDMERELHELEDPRRRQLLVDNRTKALCAITTVVIYIALGYFNIFE